jgi:exosome complex component RRP41
VSVAVHPGSGRIITLQMDSKLPLDVLESVMQLGADGCRAVAAFMREQLLEATKRRALALGTSKLAA